MPVLVGWSERLRHARKNLRRFASYGLPAISMPAILLPVILLSSVFLSSRLSVLAVTPKDVLVQAWAIDDIISFDPAEVFEIAAAEIVGNVYERLMGHDRRDMSRIFGVLVESWRVSDDGRTVFFKIRQGRSFASGNPITAADAVFSLRRVILLDKMPAFIIAQFGIDKDNVKDAIRQTGEYEFAFTMDKRRNLSFLFSCLTATVASVVDRKLVMEHEENGDLGYRWLRMRSAGSGPFVIREWRPDAMVVLERNDSHVGGPPPMARIVYRHVPENTIQRLLLEKGDIDIARKLSVEDLASMSRRDDIKVIEQPKSTLYYIGLNRANDILARPAVREALQYLINRREIVEIIAGRRGKMRQTFLPENMPGAIDDAPYALNVEKARSLLAKEGFSNGFSMTLDVRNVMPFVSIGEAVQRNFSRAGVRVKLRRSDHKQLLTRYRARRHDMVLAYWGLHYWDPHANAQAFAFNPDNSDMSAFKTLAWRNSWKVDDLNRRIVDAIHMDDNEKRAVLYGEIQREVMREGPFIMIYQEAEAIAVRNHVRNVHLGPSFDTNDFSRVEKD